MKVRAIVYDAVGTLIHVKPSVAAIYTEVARRFGSRLDVEEVRRRFPLAFAEQERLDEQAGWRTSEARERQRWFDIVTQVLDDVTDPAGCFETLFEVFGRQDVWSYEPDADEALPALQRLGYRQAVASNFDHRLHNVLAGMTPMRCLERIVVSSEIGWRKPAAEFFTMLAETLQLPPSDILFVGDDVANDYDPARQAGMQALLLDLCGRHLSAGVKRLAQLRDLLPHYAQIE